MTAVRMVSKNLLLGVFIGLTVLFASLFFVEYEQNISAIRTLPSPTTGASTGTPVYKVTFQQIGVCSPNFWLLPWAVTLANRTEVEPSNATIPAPYFYGTDNSSLTTIVFSVADGTYNWKVYPSDQYGSPSSGIVNVNGSDVVIRVYGAETGCTTTASAKA